jgi:2-polyprenyl-3-methyl-5-hydroxy-6-metoxy-1,4-benzoquinol methylase
MDSEDVESVQSGNRRWWTERTMSYDWKNKILKDRFSRDWFDEIDRRFIHGARLFAHDASAFDKIIPFARLKNKKVLEIGCGMGLHTELMLKHGANVVSVDISSTSVTATRIRAKLKGLACDVREMDAVNLDFSADTFDFVWSWGAIHHSAQTGRIVKEIHRVLKPGGEIRAMVYNLEGMPAYVIMVTKYLINFWRGKSLDACLWENTDGYIARHYSKDMLADIFNIFFRDTSVETFGQESDAVPLPRYMRKLVLPWMSEDGLRRRANKRGAFLYVTAIK